MGKLNYQSMPRSHITKLKQSKPLHGLFLDDRRHPSGVVWCTRLMEAHKANINWHRARTFNEAVAVVMSAIHMNRMITYMSIDYNLSPLEDAKSGHDFLHWLHQRVGDGLKGIQPLVPLDKERFTINIHSGNLTTLATMDTLVEGIYRMLREDSHS
jgi:hypothetical protein